AAQSSLSPSFLLPPPSTSSFFLTLPPPPISTLFPYTTLFRSVARVVPADAYRDRGARDGGERRPRRAARHSGAPARDARVGHRRSEEHTSELQSLTNLVCRLLLEKNKQHDDPQSHTQYRAHRE